MRLVSKFIEDEEVIIICKTFFWGLMKEVSGFLAFAQEGFDRVFTVALPKNQIQEEK